MRRHRDDTTQLFDPDSGKWLPVDEYYRVHNIPTYNDDDCHMNKATAWIIAVSFCLGFIALMFWLDSLFMTPQEEQNNKWNQEVNQCDDNLPILWDINSHQLYGDQNNDGILSGPECDWR